MGLFNAFKAAKGKTLVPIERSLNNLDLGLDVDRFENDIDWLELTGPEKAIFDSGLRNERLFTSDSEIPGMCGFLSGRLYKLALMVPTAQGNIYVKQFSNRYGKPGKPRRDLLHWEDDNTVLEISKRGFQTNIMLTDKRALRDLGRR